MATPQRVRVLDPGALLALPPGGKLQRYVPREVDADLDDAFQHPGLVRVLYEAGSGARRSVYEALLRNLPEAVLYTLPLRDEDWSSAPDTAVLWLPMTGDSSILTTLRRWLAGKARHAVVFAPAYETTLSEVQHELRYLNPTNIAFYSRLTATEQAEAARLDKRYAGVNTVEELVAAIITGPEPTTDESRHAAGYRADTDEGPDRLGITTDVHMLADLVASRLIEPPLSIGLFGTWGSGKSFFMRQMRQRVDELAEKTRDKESPDKHGLEVSSYCASIRQIDFNAWHYVEANLWASLATRIFDEVAAAATDQALEQLDKKRASANSPLEQLSTVRVERRIVAARGGIPKLGAEDSAWVKEYLHTDDADTEAIMRVADELRGFSNKLKRLSRNVWTWLSLAFGVVLAIGLVFLIRSPFWPVVLGAAPFATVATRNLARFGRILQAVDSRTERKLAELDVEAERLERAVAELAAEYDATAFARSRNTDYQQHLGIVSMLRKDLQTLADLLKSNTSELERVVLYIDDLDRCPPNVVIKVLEAVHLLVALPVFVVVVGVDQRLLHQAIQRYYEAVLPDSEITADNYLEKIFQVPFQLSPMDERGFGNLVQALAGEAQQSQADVDDDVPDRSTERPTPAESPAQDKPTTTVEQAEPSEPAPAAPSAEFQLQPRQLMITQEEVDFLRRLAHLVPSPRAAKRLTNLYRLVRARLSGTELNEFLAGDHFRAVLVLLAAGKPDSTVVSLPEEVYAQWSPLVRRFSFGQRGTAPDNAGGGRSG